jgi:DNA ligase (NAD+)
MEYDKLYDELLSLEKTYPQFALHNSPTKRIGSDLDNKFPEIAHTIPVLSLDKEYSVEGIIKWTKKLKKNTSIKPEFIIEEKMDGASIVLYYRKGKLHHALTRGNGFTGNDVTENIRTIRNIPLILNSEIDIIVRGEIFIRKSDFEKFNKLFENRYSNPRNLAAGSLRNIRSSVVAKVPLKMFAYEGHFSEQLDHIDILYKLKNLGFKINENFGFFSQNPNSLKRVNDLFPDISSDTSDHIGDYIKRKTEEREYLEYEIDGLVIKINEHVVREELGMTSHHPKWAIAFKFESPLEATILKDIVIQIGRNGRVTPVAILDPVKIAGSIVSRATLHNQEYIDILELGIGDKVTISKRGDVIPAVENVVEKSEENPTVFKLPAKCPFCSSKLIKDGAHHFCKNRDCPERRRRELVFFVSKGCMDIDTLGDKTISLLFEKGYINNIPDIYTFDYNKLLNEEGFQEKKISNIINSVELSKKRSFEKVLISLGFEGLSVFAAKELIRNGFDSFDKIIRVALEGNAEIFSKIEGFGETTADLIIKHFSDIKNIRMIEKLKKLGLNTEIKEEKREKIPQIFREQIWVITGSFNKFSPRSKAKKEIEKRGGRVSSSISKKTSFLLAGESPGSKLKKAKELDVKTINESEFLKMIGSGKNENS